jgi:hypothetical protein
MESLAVDHDLGDARAARLTERFVVLAADG